MFPNNDGIQYDAIIDRGTVALAQDITIERLALGTTLEGSPALMVNGGTLAVQDGFVAAQPGSTATLLVDGSDAEWDVEAFLSVGDAGDAALTVQGGGRVTAQNADIASSVGSTGQVFMTGRGSRLQVANDLDVGDRGAGALSVHDGASVNVGGSLRVGRQVEGSGDLIIGDDSSAVTVGFLLLVGDSGAGTLTISDGGQVNTLFADVGSAADANGNATIAGAGAVWTSISDLDIGDRGMGTLSIVDGGQLAAGGTTRLGREAEGQGTVVVDGAGSNLNHSGRLAVGDKGIGTFIVSGGGEASATGSLVVGVAENSSGRLTVAGPGSKVTVGGFTRIGDSGTGALEVSGGGQVVVDAVNQAFSWLLVAEDPGSMGSIVVTAADSRLDVENSLVLGGNGGAAGGAGSLSVQAGGTVTAATRIMVWNAGRVALSGGTITTNLLDLSDGGAFDFTGGLLHANTVDGNLLNEGGTVAPGTSTGGTLIKGNYTQESGVLEIELGGFSQIADYDLLDVEGVLNLNGGILEVRLLDPFVPANGNTFDILDFSSLEGAFDSLSLAELGGGLVWNTSNLYVDGTIVVQQGIVVGDMDGDGDVDFDDISGFVLALNDPAAYEAMFGVPPAVRGDTDGDGDNDFDDIDGLISILNTPWAGGIAAVPEPSTLLLTLLGLVTAASRRKRSRRHVGGCIH